MVLSNYVRCGGSILPFYVEYDIVRMTNLRIMRLLYSGVQPPRCRPLGLTRPGCDRLRATPYELPLKCKIYKSRYQLVRLSSCGINIRGLNVSQIKNEMA